MMLHFHDHEPLLLKIIMRNDVKMH